MRIAIPFLFISFFSFCNLVQGQDTLPYVLSSFQEDYVLLESPTILVDGIWDDFDAVIVNFPIGFDFLLFDTEIDTLVLNGDFTDSALAGQSDVAPGFNFILPYQSDLVARVSQSGVLTTISYEVNGVPGTRIYKAQWDNVGFHEDETGQDFVNFQLWLYEEDGAIEFHYGPSSILSPFEDIFGSGTGPTMGLIHAYDILNSEDFELTMIIQGDINNSVLVGYEEIGEVPGSFFGQPTDGMVFRLSRRVVNAASNQNIQPLLLFPTIVKSEVNVKGVTDYSNTSYQILDIAGKIIVKSTPLNNESINLEHLHSGMYIINLIEDNRIVKTGRFMKM